MLDTNAPTIGKKTLPTGTAPHRRPARPQKKGGASSTMKKIVVAKAGKKAPEAGITSNKDKALAPRASAPTKDLSRGSPNKDLSHGAVGASGFGTTHGAGGCSCGDRGCSGVNCSKKTKNNPHAHGMSNCGGTK